VLKLITLVLRYEVNQSAKGIFKQPVIYKKPWITIQQSSKQFTSSNTLFAKMWRVFSLQHFTHWFALILHSILLVFFLLKLLNPGYLPAMYALYMHNFCFAGSIKFKIWQHKQTKDLSSSNRGKLLNKVLWCLQIQEDCLRTLLLVVCVCLEVFEFVNILFVVIQG